MNDFRNKIREHKLRLPLNVVETLQMNITLKCNQSCHHCHVDSSPKRTEMMDLSTINKCLEILQDHPQIKNIDITGGAPELNPHFDYLVKEAKNLDKHIMVRHNLTVTLDGDPTTHESKLYLPEFFANYGIDVICSLPCYLESNVEAQRGPGVFEKSIESMRILNNVGYGIENSGLILNLVHNPVGAHLPSSQDSLEKDYKEHLWNKYKVKFNNLYAMTNMPINRFRKQLEIAGNYDLYIQTLVNAFNPIAALGVMCRSMFSVSYDGRIFDCDFNQMLNLQITADEPVTVFNFDYNKLVNLDIIFDTHCFGCTAGAGSSCAGVIS